MDTKLSSIEEIRSTLNLLRQDPLKKQKFPKEIWDSIIQLTKTYPLEEVAEKLLITPAYLKRKINTSKALPLEFCELPMTPSPTASDVIIELRSPSGLQAKIQGSISSLNILLQLFGR